MEEFEQFLTLEDAKVIVHMFRFRVPDEIRGIEWPGVNDRGELLHWVSLDNPVWADPSRSIDNLCWLVPMALGTDAYHLGGRVQARLHT